MVLGDQQPAAGLLDAELGQRHAVEQDPARVRRRLTAQQRHQRSGVGRLLGDQGDELAGLDVERDVRSEPEPTASNASRGGPSAVRSPTSTSGGVGEQVAIRRADARDRASWATR